MPRGVGSPPDFYGLFPASKACLTTASGVKRLLTPCFSQVALCFPVVLKRAFECGLVAAGKGATEKGAWVVPDGLSFPVRGRRGIPGEPVALCEPPRQDSSVRGFGPFPTSCLFSTKTVREGV